MRLEQRGQSMSEFVIVLPVLLLLALGAIQFGLLYHAKATLNLAAFEAARAGALNQGKAGAMQLGLANGLRPLFTFNTDHGQVIAGFDSAKTEVAAYARIDVVNPTDDALRYWKGSIPNDNLAYSKEVAPSGLTIQDANLLKILVTYCYPLQVPFINRTIVALVSGGASGLEKTCYDNLRLPLVAQGMVRMQTPYCPSC
jgi:hypothetical protein